ncbi:hypothetical protein FisN_17Hu054 [Fistulifera solaris]|uniref:Uncharacterized protein n=1 Tax=Fistulifera solaris TaxID=1519565 RepID=A0A1Z5JGJ0_FISSO|nr:hypothetical protein FisN_17Hu054 [Fistulifera solaris]|eukprot:GAX13125.1 hypothetical protein FisN_17Hu054 [Fistulifera solaris]
MNEPGPLLQLIPRDRLSRQQKALLPRERSLPIYKLLREPTDHNEFDWKNLGTLAIWRENRTVIFVSDEIFEPMNQRHVSFLLHNVGRDLCFLHCAIYGQTSAAIAQTATFFWSLEHSVETKYALRIDEGRNFDFGAFRLPQLASILDSNQERHYAIPTGVLNAEQSVFVATRPYSLRLELVGDGFAFKDDGVAFIEALE